MESEQRENPQPKEKVNSLGWFIFYCAGSILVTLIGTLYFTESYGFALYVGLPSMFGFIAGFLAPLRRAGAVSKAIVYSAIITLVLSVLGLLSGIEGGICLIMILGPLFMLILVGYSIGYLIRKYNLAGNSPILICFFLINPACLYMDAHQTMTEHTVSSATTIHAPVEKVWEVLTHRVDYNLHPNFFFRLGVNYPKDMQLVARNDSLFLSCRLRNGNTDLWVTQLEQNRKMQFRLIEDIIPVKELTIYDSIHTPHSHPEYFKLNYGEFILQPMGHGQCRLQSRSSFAYRLSPAVYWKWWSNYLVNKMHMHVLDVVKEQAEKSN